MKALHCEPHTQQGVRSPFRPRTGSRALGAWARKAIGLSSVPVFATCGSSYVRQGAAEAPACLDMPWSRALGVILVAYSSVSGNRLEPSQAGGSEVAVEFSQVVACREQMPFLASVVQTA